jgi:hypothetical protein
MVDPIPVGSPLLAEDLAEWEAAIDNTHTLSVVGGSLVKARTTNSSTVASTTALASDAVLTYAGVPAGTFLAEVHPRWTSSGGGTTADFKAAFAMPTGGLIYGATFMAMATGTTTFSGDPDMGSTGGTTASGTSIGARGSVGGSIHGRISGVMVLPNSGTVAFQWGPNTSTAETLRLDLGSWMRLTRLA